MTRIHELLGALEGEPDRGAGQQGSDGTSSPLDAGQSGRFIPLAEIRRARAEVERLRAARVERPYLPAALLTCRY